MAGLLQRGMFYDLQLQLSIFYWSCQSLPMFLQRYKHSHRECSPIQQQLKTCNKLDLMLRYSAIPEIKQHQKRNSYVNPRTYLIENTKKMIKTPHKQLHEKTLATVEAECAQPFVTPRKSYSRTSVDLSSRTGRREAAKNLRDRIWKSSDITQLVKAQEQRLLRTSNKPSIADLTEVQDKIHRYQDSALDRRREAARREWADGAVRSNLSMRASSTPKSRQKLQITNMQLKREMEESGWKRVNGQREGQVRPNTTGGYNRDRQDDNIIQPW